MNTTHSIETKIKEEKTNIKSIKTQGEALGEKLDKFRKQGTFGKLTNCTNLLRLPGNDKSIKEIISACLNFLTDLSNANVDIQDHDFSEEVKKVQAKVSLLCEANKSRRESSLYNTRFGSTDKLNPSAKAQYDENCKHLKIIESQCNVLLSLFNEMKKVNKLSAENKKLKNTKNELNSENKELKSQNKTLTENLKLTQDELEQLKERNKQLQKSNQQLQDAKQVLNNENRLLKQQLQSTENELAQSKSQAEYQSDKNRHLQTVQEVSNQKIALLSKNLELANNRVKQLTSQVANQSKENEKLQNELKKSQAANQSKENEKLLKINQQRQEQQRFFLKYGDGKFAEEYDSQSRRFWKSSQRTIQVKQIQNAIRRDREAFNEDRENYNVSEGFTNEAVTRIMQKLENECVRKSDIFYTYKPANSKLYRMCRKLQETLSAKAGF